MQRRNSDIGFVIITLLLTIALVVGYILYNDEPSKQPSTEIVTTQIEPRSSPKPSRSHEREVIVIVQVPPKDLPKPAPTFTPKPKPEPEPEPSPEYTEEEVVYEGGTIAHEDLPPIMQIIDDHESTSNGPDQYYAYNPTGCSDQNGTWSCGGRWQLSQQYASTWAANAGFPGMSPNAETWPPGIQDAVAMDLFEKTGGSLWCNYTDYC